MDISQRRALLIVIEGIEHQLKSVKALIMAAQAPEFRPAPNLEKREPDGYTTEEEDSKIAEELEIEVTEREKALFLEDLMKKARADDK